MKKLAVFTLLSILILPAQVAFAILPMDAIFAAQVMQNLQEATSSEYTVTVNVNATDTEGTEIVSLDATVEGAWENNNGNEISRFDLAYISSNYSEDVNSGFNSAVLTNERLYFLDHWSQDEDVWYFFSNTEYADVSVNVPSEDDVRNSLLAMIAEGVIATDRMSDHWVDGVLMQKYSYTIDSDKLIDLYDSYNDIYSDEDIATAKSYANEHISTYGEIWVNKDTLYPYLISLDVTLDDAESAYVTSNVTVKFNSFNENLNIVEPNNAISIYDSVEIEEPTLPEPENDPYVDTDGDGLIDISENYYQTNPNNPDTDGDGYSDYDEVMNMYNPSGPGQMDTDGDGLGDRDEVFVWHTNRHLTDSDNDGYSDAVEVRNGYDPNGPGRLDSDSDGLSDFDEITTFHTDPFTADTDHDGYSDGEEVFNGYNPNGSGRM